MEQEIVVLRKVKSECLSAVTVEWAAAWLSTFVVEDVDSYFHPRKRHCGLRDINKNAYGDIFGRIL